MGVWYMLTPKGSNLCNWEDDGASNQTKTEVRWERHKFVAWGLPIHHFEKSGFQEGISIQGEREVTFIALLIITDISITTKILSAYWTLDTTLKMFIPISPFTTPQSRYC